MEMIDVSNGFSINGFNMINNVYVDVIDTNTNSIVKRIEKHNKATRLMVEGVIRFLAGHFTATDLNDSALYSDSKKYIPCYFNVGDGGVLVEDGRQRNYQDAPRIPVLADWTGVVDYNSTKLEREFFSSPASSQSQRTVIRKVTNTVSGSEYQAVPAGDMDSLYFHCEIGPGKINEQYGGLPVFVTELGLFPTSVSGTPDLLAYVKLDNAKHESGETPTDTDVLFVRPDDTIVIRWIISLVAVGSDSTFSAMMKNENGEYIETTLKATPNLGTFELVEYGATLYLVQVSDGSLVASDDDSIVTAVG